MEIGSDHVIFSLYGPNGVFGLVAEEPTAEYPNAEALFEHDVSVFQSWLDFTIAEESEVEISGMKARFVKFKYSVPQPSTMAGGKGGPPVPTTDRYVYLAGRSGLLYSIALTSDSAVEDEYDAYFSRILQTFKILN